MSTPNDSLSDLAQQVGVSTGFDRLIEASTDVVSLVPVAGPIVASVMKQVVPKDDEIYAHQFAVEVAARILELDTSKVDRTYFESDAWTDDVDQAVTALRERRNQSKRAHFVAALTNSATTDRPDEVERLRFMDLLVRVRPSHLRLLAALVRAEGTNDDGGADVWLTTKLPDQDLENIKLDWRDLEQAGLLQGLPTGMATISTGERMWHALNAIGRRFAAFVEASPDAAPIEEDERGSHA